MINYLFLISGSGTLIFALLAILLPLPLHAMISAMISFIFTATLYLTLSVQFLALVQLLVYVGAISVLLLFMILLLQLNRKGRKLKKIELISPILIIPLFILLLPPLLTDHTFKTATFSDQPYSITSLGMTLFGDQTHLLLLELISLLLLISIIGSVLLAKRSLR